MSDLVPMTKEGYDKIKARIDEMENEEMPEILERLAAARAEGDLKENAEYHGARESQGMLHAKINMLKAKLANATIMDMSKIDKSLVAFGATVTVLDVDMDEEEVYTLVGEGEEDYDQNKIKVTGPVGQALIGAKEGDVVEIPAPKGSFEFKVLKIEYDF
jgi:transcription elongation factor GreA